MFVYANLLGNWAELTEDDNINGLPPVNFIENVLLDDDAYNTFKSSNEFVEVTIGKN